MRCAGCCRPSRCRRWRRGNGRAARPSRSCTGRPPRARHRPPAPAAGSAPRERASQRGTSEERSERSDERLREEQNLMSSDGPESLPKLDTAPAEPLLRRLELTVRNKLDGLLQGNYLGLVPGPGSEAGDSRLYFPGDDVRRMDWPVTARTTVPHVRQTIADRELETWVVVDLSPSLDFGTARTEKRELALAALTAVVHLTVRGGNRVGAIVSTGEQTVRMPARGGTAHARHLMNTIASVPRAQEGQRGDLASMLEQLRRPPRRRGLVAVVSDFLGDADWERPLRA